MMRFEPVSPLAGGGFSRGKGHDFPTQCFFMHFLRGTAPRKVTALVDVLALGLIHVATVLAISGDAFKPWLEPTQTSAHLDVALRACPIFRVLD